MRLLRVLLAAWCLLVVLPAAPAWAHAALLESDPADGALLTEAPATVELRYSEPVGTSLGAVRVLAPDGSRVDTGRVSLRDDGHTVVAPLQPEMAHGTYTLLWRVVSQDSHPVTGASTFSIGHATGTAAAADPAQAGEGSAAGDLLTASRLVLFTGLVLLVGGGTFLLLLWPAGLSDRIAGRLLWTGWALALTGSAAGLLLQGPYAAGLPLASAVDGALVAEVVQTRFGVASAVRLLLLAAMVPLLLGLARWGRGLLAAGWAVLSAGVLLSTSAVGHAAAGDLVGLALPADSIHLAAMAAWLGGLVLLGLVVLRRSTDELASVLPGWSRYAATAVGVLVVTGTFASWREVRELSALTSTSYGRLLLVKALLVGLMLLLGAVGRSWVRRHYLLPVVHAATDVASPVRTPPSPLAVQRLRRSVLMEAGTAAVVLSVTAFLVETTPARSAYAPVFSEVAAVDGPLRVQVDVEPARTGLNDIHVYYTAEGGKAVDVPEVNVRWTRDGTDDVIPVELERDTLGHYERLRVALPSAGTWQLAVTTRTTDIDSTTTRFTVRVR
jgi:copper transport protein